MFFFSEVVFEKMHFFNYRGVFWCYKLNVSPSVVCKYARFGFLPCIFNFFMIIKIPLLFYLSVNYKWWLFLSKSSKCSTLTRMHVYRQEKILERIRGARFSLNGGASALGSAQARSSVDYKTKLLSQHI